MKSGLRPTFVSAAPAGTPDHVQPFRLPARKHLWYAPVYNLAWVLFMVYALTLPPLLLALFKLPVLREIQPSAPWSAQRHTYGYLLGAAFVIFSFRLIPYWIFNDKILHFLGGGIAIALVYQYLALNLPHRGRGGHGQPAPSSRTTRAALRRQPDFAARAVRLVFSVFMEMAIPLLRMVSLCTPVRAPRASTWVTWCASLEQ